MAEEIMAEEVETNQSETAALPDDETTKEKIVAGIGALKSKIGKLSKPTRKSRKTDTATPEKDGTETAESDGVSTAEDTDSSQPEESEAKGPKSTKSKTPKRTKRASKQKKEEPVDEKPSFESDPANENTTEEIKTEEAVETETESVKDEKPQEEEADPKQMIVDGLGEAVRSKLASLPKIPKKSAQKDAAVKGNEDSPGKVNMLNQNVKSEVEPDKDVGEIDFAKEVDKTLKPVNPGKEAMFGKKRPRTVPKINPHELLAQRFKIVIPKYVYRFLVPAALAPRAIGSRGKIINDIVSKLSHIDQHANIRIHKLGQNGEPLMEGVADNVMEISGTPAALKEALFLITPKLQFPTETKKKLELRLIIPTHSVKVVVGHKGEHIKQVRNETKSFIQTYQVSLPLSEETVMRIQNFLLKDLVEAAMRVWALAEPQKDAEPIMPYVPISFEQCEYDNTGSFVDTFFYEDAIAAGKMSQLSKPAKPPAKKPAIQQSTPINGNQYEEEYDQWDMFGYDVDQFGGQHNNMGKNFGNSRGPMGPMNMNQAFGNDMGLGPMGQMGSMNGSGGSLGGMTEDDIQAAIAEGVAKGIAIGMKRGISMAGSMGRGGQKGHGMSNNASGGMMRGGSNGMRGASSGMGGAMRGSMASMRGNMSGRQNQGMGQGGYNQGMGQGGHNQGMGQGGYNQGMGQGDYNQGMGQGGYNQGMGQGGYNQGMGQGGYNQGMGQGGYNQGMGQGGYNQGMGQGGYNQGMGQGGYNQGAGSSGLSVNMVQDDWRMM